MSAKYNFRIRPPKTMRKDLEAGASEKLVSYRAYLKAVLTKAAEKRLSFAPPTKAETVESRILLQGDLKPIVQKLAKLSKRTPEEWAIEVLKMHNQVMGK
jgi:hypothetical protein